MSTVYKCDLCGKTDFPVQHQFTLKKRTRFFDGFGHGSTIDIIDAHQKCIDKLFKAAGNEEA